MKKLLSIICIWLICSQNMLIIAEEAKKEKTIEGPVIGIDLVLHIHVLVYLEMVV